MDELTDEQKEFIKNNWDKMDLQTLTRKVFNDGSLDGRSKEARVIRKYLGDRRPKTTQFEKKPDIILTDSQKEFIENNIGSMTPFEIAKVIFDDAELPPLSKEVLTIDKYVKEELEDDVERLPHEDYAQGEYKAPDQLSAVVTRVNIFLRTDLTLKNMPLVQRKAMESIRDFLHAPRFIHTINSYVTRKAREMFEGEFLRTVFDKSDLTPDELNLSITLCQLYVQQVTLHRHLDMLNQKYEDVLNDPDGKVTVALSEMIKAKTGELEKCNKAQSDLVKFLSGERSKRQEKQGGTNTSISRLVEWFRDEEERKRALQRAAIQAEEDEDEIDKLETISEMKARVMGISKSELLNG